MKFLLVFAVVFSSVSVFAFGRVDKSKIKERLDEIKAENHECVEKHEEGVYQSDIKPSGKSTTVLECKKSADDKEFKKIAKIVYQLDGNQYAKCRSSVAISITDIESAE